MRRRKLQAKVFAHPLVEFATPALEQPLHLTLVSGKTLTLRDGTPKSRLKLALAYLDEAYRNGRGGSTAVRE